MTGGESVINTHHKTDGKAEITVCAGVRSPAARQAGLTGVSEAFVMCLAWPGVVSGPLPNGSSQANMTLAKPRSHFPVVCKDGSDHEPC